MDDTRNRHRDRRNPYRGLLHLLNQRYHAEWVRAELLARELAAMKQSWPGRVMRLLGRVKRWFCPPRSTREAALAAQYQYYALLMNVCQVKARISIIIPFRDQPELLANCLRSLRLGTQHQIELILVDNGSKEPRTRRLIQRLASRGHRVIDSPGPFNFSRLCNLGAAVARGEFFLFLNNDTEVLSRDWLQQMLHIAGDPRVGAVGATLLYPNGTIQHAGLFPRTDGEWVHPYRGRPADDPGDEGELRRPRSVPAVTAACLMIRRSVFQDVNGFDERFPVTMNDVDLCERLRKRGLLVVVTPEARFVHYESLSRGYGPVNSQA